MRSVIMLLLALVSLQATAQKDKSARPSPPALVTQKISGGATISIDYSQPSVKGRQVGVDLEPLPGKVWRTGANEATVFSTDKDIMVEGMLLPAGKYGLFTIYNDNDVTVIFNKTWDQWGAFTYKEADDQLRVKGKLSKQVAPTETMKITVGEDGKVDLLWGPTKASFQVK